MHLRAPRAIRAWTNLHRHFTLCVSLNYKGYSCMAEAQVVGAPAKKKTSVLGMVAVGLGVLAFFLAWVPCFGVFSWGFSGLGLVLAIVGLVMASSNKDTGMGWPVAGLVAC